MTDDNQRSTSRVGESDTVRMEEESIFDTEEELPFDTQSQTTPVATMEQLHSSQSEPKTKTVWPATVLVCISCNEYYEHAPDWGMCPKCGDELVEVDKHDE